MVVYPEYINLSDWSARLIESYPKQHLPLLEDEEQWIDWAATVASTGVFAKNNVPLPFEYDNKGKKNNYENWEDWAKKLYNIMINSKDFDEAYASNE